MHAWRRLWRAKRFSKGEFGYQASSKAAFIRNIQNWKRVQVKILAKIKDSNYVLLATYPIKQEIEGVRVRYHSKEAQG